MKIQFDVIHFDQQDTIATSASICMYNGVQHIIPYHEPKYDPDSDTTTVFAAVVDYREDRSILYDDVTNVTVPGKHGFVEYVWYHYNGTGYTLCVPQEH